MNLTHRRTLGHSGLAVSPLALGTMTFGTARWGTNEDASRAVFNAYVEAGGNFVDTADVYAGGHGEVLLGRFIAERKLRDQLVLATKAGFAAGAGAHSGGAGAKHLHAALDASLRRLSTDAVDVFWLHVWDGVTPADELVETMSQLVRAGKTRTWALSNVPAWYAARVSTVASLRGAPGPIALQSFYSLVNRDIEDEHVPMAQAHGLGIVPWSPLAYGLLTGRYDRQAVEAKGPRGAGLPKDAGAPDAKRADDDKRLDGQNPFGDSLFTERNWRIVDEVVRVARAVERSPAQVALSWVLGRPGVSSTLIGASRPEQVADNVAALSLSLPPEHRAALDAVSAPAPRLLYTLFASPLRDHAVFGGEPVTGWGER